MTDKEYKAFTSKVSKLYKKWIKTLGLAAWDISCVTVRGHSGYDDGRQADCRAQWEYRQASMRFYADVMEELSDDEIEAVFLHECCHILINEMHEFGSPKMTDEEMTRAMMHEERAATEMSMAILTAYKAGLKEGGKLSA